MPPGAEATWFLNRYIDFLFTMRHSSADRRAVLHYPGGATASNPHRQRLWQLVCRAFPRRFTQFPPVCA
jgi:hypothetical protein